MQGKVTLEDHFAIEATLGDSQPFGPHVWPELRHRLLDFHDQRLRLMDASGVEVTIISLNAPAIQAIPESKRAAEVARRANDALATEVAKRPDRFVGVAALPMQDPEIAIHELQRCIEREGDYLLLVRWESVEAHEVGFRKSPQYQEWKKLLHHFYDPFPAVEHYGPSLIN